MPLVLVIILLIVSHQSLILGPTSATSINSINIEEVFPAPDVIIRDLFELYKDNKKVKEKDLALLNYVKLLFNRLNS